MFVLQCRYVWQSHVEIKGYSVAYFNRIIVFELTLKRRITELPHENPQDCVFYYNSIAVFVVISMHIRLITPKQSIAYIGYDDILTVQVSQYGTVLDSFATGLKCVHILHIPHHSHSLIAVMPASTNPHCQLRYCELLSQS